MRVQAEAQAGHAQKDKGKGFGLQDKQAECAVC